MRIIVFPEKEVQFAGEGFPPTPNNSIDRSRVLILLIASVIIRIREGCGINV